ncbi:hypothetical protein DSO57_1003008 [Entomophthora muscae]|uniref:Uncharacterized protein n=1 Tax=Entomophthora muscae TaxID=34485 RepID=A0ACC2SXS5_9FUNG|nr:hypothetical protein DSO57_1003008 [Entomophthora muscae]
MPSNIEGNISDNTLGQDKLLSAIELKEQNKKLQKFPLIGETATKRRAKDSQIKEFDFEKDGFYTPPAVCRLHAQLLGACRPHAKPDSLPAHACRQPVPQPASGGQRTPHSRTAHPHWMGKLLNGETQKAISPNPKGGGSAAQIWNLPNLGGADKLPNTTIPALTAEVKFGCMKAPNNTPNQCKPRSNNSLPAYHFQFPSQKGIPDNTKCLGFPVQCFALFIPHKDDSI